MRFQILSLVVAIAVFGTACSTDDGAQTDAAGGTEQAAADGGQSNVQDDQSQKDIVKVAVSSKDHTTLVKALQAAGLVDELSNAGPFTVFAPTNAAFDALPAGTLEELVKPENKEKLETILYHHVQVSIYSLDRLASSPQIMMFDGKAEPIESKDGAVYIGGAKILGEVRASNGVVYVVDKVILAD